MKVLFAVSNENISESIVKKYQKDYKEIISSKNVYYFNAIQKELQKDNTYDRIVISEDLEPFTNNNYDAIDRFIFDKLDAISDEATNSRRNDTPIILICSDRRAKAEDILVKLFSIGIYDAVLGNDRSIDQICKLIRKPRVIRCIINPNTPPSSITWWYTNNHIRLPISRTSTSISSSLWLTTTLT